MTKQVLIRAGIAELEIAVIRDGVVENYWSEMTLDDESEAKGGTSRVGDIVVGRVKRVLPAIDAAFVDIGDERDGFLNARDAVARSGTRQSETPSISELVHEGDTILVQVLKDAMGDKGARIGVHVTLPGRFLVFTPQGGRVALSRKIEDETERARLNAIMENVAATGGDAGYVVRTAAIGASEDELREDVEFLSGIWADILAAKADAEPPETLHSELGSLERALRDQVGSDVDRVIIETRSAWNAARAYADEAMPGMSDRFVLHEGAEPVFAAFGIEDDVAALALPEVALPSGGWIVIEPTEALTAIDVNSGSHMGRAHLSATALAVDLEAAEAIARQVILRAIGGTIVIDFIPVPDEAGFTKVVETLRAALKRLGAVAEVARMPGMNLVAVTLKRTRLSLDRRRAEGCRMCEGHGRRLTVGAIALAALRQVERSAISAPGKPIAMRVGSEVAAWLEARAGLLRTELQRRGITALKVFPEPARPRDSFAVETLGQE
ncbi:MAG: hypothetical protein RJB62_1002 [Pseudomonadota bacterium]|jgi:ribonuclease G